MRETIRFRDLTKRFGETVAVDNFSLDVEDKRIIGFLGPNGAGKTTAIMVMATVYRPTSGTVEVEGYDVTVMPERVRELLGICFQDPKFDNRLPIQSVLEWHAKVAGVPRELRVRRIEEVLKRIDLWEDRSKKGFTLYPWRVMPYYVSAVSSFSPVTSAAEIIQSSLFNSMTDLTGWGSLLTFVFAFFALSSAFYYKRIEGGRYK